MNCERAEGHLSAYVDHTLDARLSQQISLHLESCDHCRALVEEYRELDELLSTAPRIAPSDALRDRLFSSAEFLAIQRAHDEEVANAAAAAAEETEEAPAVQPRAPRRRLSPRRLIPHPTSPVWSRVLLPVAAALAIALSGGVLLKEGVFPFAQTQQHTATVVSIGNPGQGAAPLAAGSRLIYLRGGTLWSAPEAGAGIAQALTMSSVNVSVWSVTPLPGKGDTSLVAYIDAKTHALHVVRSDGLNDQAVASGALGGIQWAPDGSRIAYLATSAGGATLHVINSDGTNNQAISAPDASASAAIWSPDTLGLVYTQTTSGAQSVWFYSLVESATRQLSNATLDDISQLAWLPDTLHPGVTWASMRDGLITGVFSQLVGSASPPQRLTPLGARYTTANYSPARAAGAWLLGKDTTLTRVSTQAPGEDSVATASGAITHIAWSPSGTSAAVVVGDRLFLWSSDHDLVALDTNLSAAAPVWSVDGQNLLYATDTQAKVANISGGHAGASLVVASASHVVALQWAPDGRVVALVAASGVTLASIDGAHVKTVDTRLADGGALTWSVAR